MTTRSRTGSIRSKQFPDFQAHKATKYPPQMFHITISESEPSCYRKAASDPRFANQSRAHVSHIKQQLQNLRQGSKSCSDYLQFAKGMADQLAVIGKPLDDEDLISSITNGLNPSFIHFVTNLAFATREKLLSFDDFQDMLLNHEMLLNNHQVAAPDVSTFALFAHKTSPHNFKNKGSYQSNSRQQPHNNHYAKPNGFPAFRSQQENHSHGAPRFNNAASGFFNNKTRFSGGSLAACCGVGGPYNYNQWIQCGDRGARVYADPSLYANWDGQHMTEAAYQIIASYILEPFKERLSPASNVEHPYYK
ncbi:hypothetical protein HHK36_019985 [Tetracentron sinense]|uniref:GDSL esterase/lipase n=1 Tax=Tetracentron sinense TaxID=13715 RepID=A0A834YYB1_TETSI|nr:hypothetical protein HHK36_019985 [Tetracentron sinense]